MVNWESIGRIGAEIRVIEWDLGVWQGATNFYGNNRIGSEIPVRCAKSDSLSIHFLRSFLSSLSFFPFTPDRHAECRAALPERPQSAVGSPKVWWHQCWQIPGEHCRSSDQVSFSNPTQTGVCLLTCGAPGREYVRQNRLVVVCSARSGESKQTGTTNRLIRAADEALRPGSTEFVQIIQDLLDDHQKVADELIRDPEIRHDLKKDIERDCAKLRSFLEAAQIISEISPRSRDIIIGVGEKLSCRIVAAVLQDRVS